MSRSPLAPRSTTVTTLYGIAHGPGAGGPVWLTGVKGCMGKPHRRRGCRRGRRACRRRERRATGRVAEELGGRVPNVGDTAIEYRRDQDARQFTGRRDLRGGREGNQDQCPCKSNGENRQPEPSSPRAVVTLTRPQATDPGTDRAPHHSPFAEAKSPCPICRYPTYRAEITPRSKQTQARGLCRGRGPLWLAFFPLLSRHGPPGAARRGGKPLGRRRLGAGGRPSRQITKNETARKRLALRESRPSGGFPQ